MGVVLVHAANRHPPNNPGDTESYRQDQRIQRRTEQLSLLPGTTPDTGHDPHRHTELAAMPELQLQIVEFTREHGRVTIGEAIKLTGVGRNTLKQHFRALVERGTLSQHGSGRGVWYDLR